MGTVSIGGVDYEVYGTRDTANAYLKARTGTTKWDAKSGGDRDKILVTVARFLNRQRWKGTKTSGAQPLAWPRTGITVDGVAVDPNTIPQAVLDGSYELALILANDPSVESTSGSGSNVRRAKGGKAEVEFFRPTSGDATETRFPTIVQEYLGPYLAGSGNALGVPYAGGTCVEPSWSDFGLTQ